MKTVAEKELPQWMSSPKIETEFPGLAYIHPLNEVIIVKKADVLHDIISKKGKRFTIFNKEGQKVFLAIQETRYRKFYLKIFNFYGNEVIQVKRPFRLCSNRVLVWAPPGNFLGSVEEVTSCLSTYVVKNKLGNIVLVIKAKGFCRFDYDVLSHNNNIGVVKNNWEMRTKLQEKNFGVSFPEEMDFGDKIMLIGACFLMNCVNKCIIM